MAAADHQRERGKTHVGVFEQDGVNMTFDMIHRDRGEVAGEAERLGIGDADQQGADQVRVLR